MKPSPTSSSSPQGSGGSNNNDVHHYENSDNHDVAHLHNGISISNLGKSYGTFAAINSLNLDVHPGDIFGFIGPNGAGKTTTIRILCGLVLPSYGSARVAGFDVVRDSQKIRRIVGLLPESSGFYNWMNAHEYLMHFAELYNVDKTEAKIRVGNLLDKVGLADKSYVPIGYYSRGMKQRLGLARTLINEPQVLFLDEPTLGLDPSGQHQIQNILTDLNREKGVTVFLSSHALAEVASICNRIAIVDHGELIATGTMDELRRLVDDVREVRIRVSGNYNDVHSRLSGLPFEVKVKDEDDDDITASNDDNGTTDNRTRKMVSVIVPDVQGLMDGIIGAIQAAGLQIYDIQRRETSLEDIFFELLAAKHTGFRKEVKRKEDARSSSNREGDKS